MMIVKPIEDMKNEDIEYLFLSIQDLKNNQEAADMLREFGYITEGKDFDWTIEGKQNTDKYWYEVSSYILAEMKACNDLNILNKTINDKVRISRALFNKIVDNLVSIGQVTEITRFITA
jgi:hypothetical protein